MRVRANGTGSVYKRGKTWTAQVVIDYRETGTPIYKRKGGFKTKTEALNALPTLKDLPTQAPNLSYYYNAFCSGRGDKISDSKRTAYRIAFQRLEPLKHKPINEITIVELQRIVSGLTYYPARDIRALLNHLYKMAAVAGHANPAIPGLLELPKLEEKSRDAFTEEEQIALWLSYESGNKAAAAPLIMIYTGMMTGEMRQLTVEMIDWEAKEIVGVGLKTDERKRKSVILPDDIVPVLADVAEGKTGRLYTMGEEDFYTYYYNALKEAGIERHLTPYSCRHTTATALAITEGIAPQTVKRLMRWTSTKMMDRYVHPRESDAREAINRL